MSCWLPIKGPRCAAGIPYELLNAKPENVERESEIVAQSGRRGAVTIATNMAGRGTDILLGGNPEYMARVRAAERPAHVQRFSLTMEPGGRCVLLLPGRQGWLLPLAPVRLALAHGERAPLWRCAVGPAGLHAPSIVTVNKR